jgi:hypothetical protein
VIKIKEDEMGGILSMEWRDDKYTCDWLGHIPIDRG